MSLSMYAASIPVFIHALENLSNLLKKGESFAKSRKFEPSVLVNARLAPDMFPLSRQVQIASDIVKGGAARLAGIAVPSFEDNETTFAQLQERISKTTAFLKTVGASQVDGSEEREIVLKVGANEMRFDGQAYLLHFVLPNLYFHSMATYAILRHNGVDVGKMDFLGAIQ